MRLAVAGGKGGCGKTLVATSLAVVAHGNTWLLDCDVDAPNAHLYFGEKGKLLDEVRVEFPSVSAELCTLCGQCGEACRFGAIVPLKEEVLTFPELCISCGGCALACPAGAIEFKKREVGKLFRASPKEGLTVLTGELAVGEIRAVPVIESMKRVVEHESPELVIIDCPPGTSCPVVEAVDGADLCVLVAEPTMSGVHDLASSLELVSTLDIPCSVVLNKAASSHEVEELCARHNVPILMRIPYDEGIAKVYSAGVPMASVNGWGAKFEELLLRIEQEVGS